MPCTGEHLAGANPRMADTCIRCGHVMPDYNVPRDFAAERRLLDLAGQAAGLSAGPGKRHPAILGLEAAAQRRALLSPNGAAAHMMWLPPGRSFKAEGREEQIDATAHYYLWEAVLAEPGMVAGEHQAIVDYDVSMRTLVPLLVAWRERHTVSQ